MCYACHTITCQTLNQIPNTKPNTKHQTPNTKHQTSNIKHQTSNIKHQTSNIKSNTLILSIESIHVSQTFHMYYHNHYRKHS